MADFSPAFVPDLVAIDALLTSPAGPVGVDMRTRSQVGLEAARAAAPKRSGRLAEGLVYTEQNLGGEIFFEIFSTAPYADYVSEGTKPHRIQAKGKKALAFSAGGTTIVVKSVQHPGTKPDPYLVEAIIAAVR